MSSPHVLIAGAGIAGLAAALTLGRLGWRATIVERAPDLRADGYMIGLSGPGHAAATRLGLLPALQPHLRDVGENVYRDRNGKELLRLRYRELLQGFPWITLPRTELVAVLRQAAARFTKIRFGVTVTGFTQDAGGVTATLSDGSTERADLLIGADGARSAMGRLLFGDPAPAERPLGYRAAAFRVPDQLNLGEDFLSYAEPGRLAETYVLADGELATLYVWRTQETDFVPLEQRRDLLRKNFAGTHPAALGWIEELPPAAPLYLDALTMLDRPAWSTGRVALLGDAAHCLTLVSGQGAGMAMASACLLAEEIGRGGDIPAALARHEARLRPPIRRLQAHSQRMSKWFVPASPFAFAMRNALVRRMPRWLLARQFIAAIRREQALVGGL
ncbi:FAD-dependent monooxygenase [Roseomonas sp. 18066]|uniref:FAD-dependent monooxygenase n=1 Tax=Roseomonas sp. 18066 TaxID=2681412 RepID=UPI00135AA02B|nr:FAD-dependent monooxygenase [Roseomonas sp. 18066]